jgi:hypothetical protein
MRRCENDGVFKTGQGLAHAGDVGGQGIKGCEKVLREVTRGLQAVELAERQLNCDVVKRRGRRRICGGASHPERRTPVPTGEREGHDGRAASADAAQRHGRV